MTPLCVHTIGAKTVPRLHVVHIICICAKLINAIKILRYFFSQCLNCVFTVFDMNLQPELITRFGSNRSDTRYNNSLQEFRKALLTKKACEIGDRGGGSECNSVNLPFLQGYY